jgi:hypothetical protein
MLIPLGFLAGSGAVASDYELIETQILGSSQASVVFSGLGTYSSTYKHLQVRMTSKATGSATIFGTFNGDNGANYVSHRLFGNGSSVTSDAHTSRNNFFGGNNEDGSITSSFSAGVLDILDAFSTTKNKTTKSFSGVSTPFVMLQSGAWLSTASITSITLAPNLNSFLTGSRFSLYGIRG